MCHMGGKDSCNGCTDCSCDNSESLPKAPKQHYGNPHYRPEASEFLQGREEPPIPPDSTPLTDRCQHYQHGVGMRYQCETCIASWVLAVGRAEAEEMAESYAGQGQSIAATRIRRAVQMFLEEFR